MVSSPASFKRVSKCFLMLEKSMSRNFPPVSLAEVFEFPICFVAHGLGSFFEMTSTAASKQGEIATNAEGRFRCVQGVEGSADP